MTDAVNPGPSTTPDQKNTPSVGLRFAVVFALAVTLSLLLSLVALDRVGVAARVVPSTPPQIVVVDDAEGLIDAWDKARLHGALLVDVTRDLGYAVPPGAFPLSSGWPVPLRDLQSVFRDVLERRSVIWVAAKLGIIRSVTYVLDPTALEEAIRAGREKGYPGISPDGRSVKANDEGYLRFIGDRFPADLGQAAALNIDASYFVNGTPEDLAAQLDKSVDSYRLVTLNRARDATDVPEAARVQLDRMADILRARESR